MALPKNLHSTDFKPFDFGKRIKSAPERGAQFSVIYARGGAGKSVIASYAESPVILSVGLETGARGMNCPKFPEISEYDGLSSIDHVFSAINYLIKEKHSRKTLIIDNLGTFREEVTKDVIKDFPTETKAFALAPKYYQYYEYLLSAIAALQTKRNMDVILLAHDVLYTVNDPSGSWYDRVGINAISGKNTDARALIEARVNNCFYIRDEPITRDDNRGVIKQEGKKMVAGAGKRVIYTRPKENFFAKCRLNMAEKYVIEKSDSIHDLLVKKTNQSIIDFWEAFYNEDIDTIE